MRIAGAAGATVTPWSTRVEVSHGVSVRLNRPGSTRRAPTATAANGRPQHCAWNMGVSSRAVSAMVMPRVDTTACACSQVARCE